MAEKYKNATRGPLALAGGRVLDLAEVAPVNAVDPKDPHDKALIDDGALIEAGKTTSKGDSE